MSAAKKALEEAVLVASTLQTWRNLYFLLISMVLTYSIRWYTMCISSECLSAESQGTYSKLDLLKTLFNLWLITKFYPSCHSHLNNGTLHEDKFSHKIMSSILFLDLPFFCTYHAQSQWAWKLSGENLQVVLAKFSTLSLAVLLLCKKVLCASTCPCLKLKTGPRCPLLILCYIFIMVLTIDI
jgi:hypothetical protein